MLTEFVDYVYSFYGDKKEALYPLFNVDTDKQVDKTDILGAVYDYLHEITRRNDEYFTWGDGDSLDRERVRDILVIKYGYDKTFYGDKKEALYPLFNVDNDKQVTKADIICATYDYLHEVNKRNDDHFTWGDGDSLDRERVRDILVIKYGYDKTFYGGSVLWEDFRND